MAGPSGVEQALLAGWPAEALAMSHAATRNASRTASHETAGRPAPQTPAAAAQTFIVAGSRSPVTAQQVRRAQADGFALLDIDPARAAEQSGEPDGGHYCRDLAARAVRVLQDGRSVVAHTTLAGEAPAGSGRALALGAGHLMRQVLQRHKLARVGFAGGDTSSLAVQAGGGRSGARALTLAYTLSPGVAVCKVHAADAALDGVELMLKGGQMGPPDVFEALRQGRRIGVA